MRRVLLAALAVAVLGIGSNVLSAAISQGYRSASELAAGTMVVITSSTNEVSPATSQNGNGLLGVVVGSNEATLSIVSGNDNLQVATTGSTEVFVSDVAGKIRSGDQVAPSPIEGVGMRASETGKIVGIAQADFDASKSIKKMTLTTKDGKSQEVSVGTIPVAIQVAYYSSPPGVVPGFMQDFANTIAGKQVALARLIIVAVILLTGLTIVTILIFSVVRGSVVSLGRNPLAKASIFRGLAQAVMTALVVFVTAIAGAYVVIRY